MILPSWLNSLRRDVFHGSDLATLVTNTQAMVRLTRIPKQHSKMLDLQTAHCSCPCTTTVFSGDWHLGHRWSRCNIRFGIGIYWQDSSGKDQNRFWGKCSGQPEDNIPKVNLMISLLTRAYTAKAVFMIVDIFISTFRQIGNDKPYDNQERNFLNQKFQYHFSD